jgi:predicted DNA binding CopG/RHH family protein
MKAKKPVKISAEEFDRRFDDGEDMTPYLDFSKAKRFNIQNRRVNVDFPAWMVNALDREAAKMGITRQSLIKVVVHDHLKENASA